MAIKLLHIENISSLIRGGVASYQIDFSEKLINSSSRNCDVLSILDPDALQEYFDSVNQNGIIIYDDKDLNIEEYRQILEEKNIQTIFLDTQKLTEEAGGIPIMANVVILGYIWKLLNFELPILETVLEEKFKNKDIDMCAELNCLHKGYDVCTEQISKYIGKRDVQTSEYISLTGNDAIALGAISGGVRAYYAYPMTPSTSILKYLGDTYKETGILVKQAENEITAIQMSLGSMYMGTRSMVATSGGGFDLMTETLSCSGITETPLVLVLSQRTGAGTGVPTWTGAGDLNAVLNAGHSDYPRCVVACSDPISSYKLTQQALNIAEQYQIPVILLTEKQISESIYVVEKLPQPEKIERGLTDDTNERYSLTEKGVSPRWKPDFNSKPYLSTSDEHLEDGTSTERSGEIIKMSDKRQRKFEHLKNNIPEPSVYGKGENIIVGWGSTKNTVLDAISEGLDVTYVHFDYISPLKTETLQKYIDENKRIIVVDNNQTGQFSKLIKQETGYTVEEKILKYDGRPFFVEDILDFFQNND